MPELRIRHPYLADTRRCSGGISALAGPIDPDRQCEAAFGLFRTEKTKASLLDFLFVDQNEADCCERNLAFLLS